MHPKRIILTLITLPLGWSALQAQTELTVDHIRNSYHRNCGAIYRNGQTEGYFLLYQVNEVDKQTNAYTLDILDKDLHKVNEISFRDDRKVVLLEAACNGDALLFLYNDKSRKTLQAQVLSLDGKLRFTYTKVLDKRSERFFDDYDLDRRDKYANSRVFDVGNDGFGLVIPLREGRHYTYEVDYYRSDTKSEYTYTPQEDEKWASASYLGCTDSLILLEETRQKHLASGTPTASVVAIDYVTRKKAFVLDPGHDLYRFMPLYSKSLPGTGSFLLMGPYFNKTDDMSGDYGLGLAIYVVNTKGEVRSTTYNSWAKDIGRYLPLNRRGKVYHIGYLFIHNIVQAKDGSLYAIGEGYKRTADVSGIIYDLIMGWALFPPTEPYTEIRITDLVVLKFTPDYKIAGATIQKKRFSTYRDAGVDLSSQHELAMSIKESGDFDYAFTMRDPDESSFDVCYTNFERRKHFHGMTFHTMRVGGSITGSDEIALNSKASSERVLPGRPGYVMVYQYFKKQGRIDLHLEKMN